MILSACKKAFILGFWLPLESVIGICQHEEKLYASENQESYYEAEK